MLGFARAGSELFWKSVTLAEVRSTHVPLRAEMLAVAILIALLAALAALALPVTRYMEATAAQLLSPRSTIDTILTGGGR